LYVRVAGPAALLVAKVHKIADREGSDRQSDKDALDVLRLLRGTKTEDLVTRFMNLLADNRSMEAARRGLELLETQFAKRKNSGVEMAIRSVGVLGDADEISAVFETLVGDFMAALR
jgi:F0F1-type ATP synthase delta subunit